MNLPVKDEELIPDAAAENSALHIVCGAFVTLKENGNLRGCIGTMTGRLPLHETVSAMAASSAFHDPRFSPVLKEELNKLIIEISVLSPMETIEDPFSIIPGIHGLYIIYGPNSGVLLPQVASEQGWGVKEFVEHTCFKAGLTPEILKDGKTRYQSFTVTRFSETDLL